MPDIKTRERITDIQILRAIAIIFVLFVHFSIFTSVFEKMNLVAPFYLGVEIFLIISGFGIGMSVMTSQFNIKKFAQKRVFKLIPGLVIVLILSGIVNYLVLNMNLSDFIRNTFAVDGISYMIDSIGVLSGTYILMDAPKSYFLGAFWYLSVLFQFYICVGIFSYFIYKLKNKERADRILFYVSILIVFIIFCARILNLFGIETFNLLHYITNWRFDFLFLGIILSYLKLNYKVPKLISSPKMQWMTWVLILIPLIALSFMEQPAQNLEDLPILSGIGYPLCAICFFILVWRATYNNCFRNLNKKVYRFLQGCGDRSYSLYLYNFLGLVIAWLLMYKFSPWVMESSIYYGIAQFVVGSIVIVLISELNYRIIEKPFSAFGKMVIKASDAKKSIIDGIQNSLER